MWVTSYEPFTKLASLCDCLPADLPHPRLQARSTDEFPTRQTSEYPTQLVSQYAQLAAPLLSTGSGCFTLWSDIITVPEAQNKLIEMAAPKWVQVSDVKVWNNSYIYAGRGDRSQGLERSEWANDFPISEHGLHNALQLFQRQLEQKPALLQRLPELAGKILVCHCGWLKAQCHCAILSQRFRASFEKETKPDKLSPHQPLSLVDGGGLPSTADWSIPPANRPDYFKAIRHSWIDYIVKQKMVPRIIGSIIHKSPENPITMHEEAHLHSLAALPLPHNILMYSDLGRPQYGTLDIPAAVLRHTEPKDVLLDASNAVESSMSATSQAPDSTCLTTHLGFTNRRQLQLP